MFRIKQCNPQSTIPLLVAIRHSLGIQLAVSRITMAENPEAQGAAKLISDILKKLSNEGSAPVDKQALSKVDKQPYERRKKADELKKTELEKHPKDSNAKPTKVEEFHEKVQEHMVQKGTVPTIEQKIVMMGDMVSDPSVSVLQDQYKALKQELTQPASQDSRTAILNRMKEISKVAATYPENTDLVEIAKEMKQEAYGHLVRNQKDYFANTSGADRLAIGEIFYEHEVNPHKVYEDQRYLKEIEPHKPVSEPQPDVAANEQVARDMVAISKKAGTYHLESAFLTLPHREPMDADLANRKIDDGPEWVKKIRKEIKQNPHTLTTLAEIAEADKALQNDPNYLFVKGAQLSFTDSYAYQDVSDPSNPKFDLEGIDQIRDVNAKIHKQIDSLPTKIDLEKGDIDRAFSAEARFAGNMGMSPMPAGVTHEIYWDGVTTDILNPSNPTEAAMINLFEGFNAYVGPLGEGEFDKQVFNLAHQLTEKYYAELHKVPVIFEKIMKRVSYLEKHDKERYMAYNNMSFERDKQKRVFSNIEFYLQSSQDRILVQKDLYPTQFQEGIQYVTRNATMFIEDENFYDQAKAYWEDEENWPEINKYYDTSLAITDIASRDRHPMYQKMADKEKWKIYFEGVKKEFSTIDLLSNVSTTLRVKGIRAAGEASVAFGEHAAIIIRNGRNGFNDIAYNIVDNFGFTARFVGRDNKIQTVWGVPMDNIFKKARAQLLEEKSIHLPKLQAVYGVMCDYETMVDSALTEVNMLLDLDGRPVRWMDNGLPAYKGADQNGTPMQFGITGHMDELSTSIHQLESREDKWSMKTAVPDHMIELMAGGDAERLNVADYVDEVLDNINLTTDEGKQRFDRLKAHEFGIHEDKGAPNYKDVVKRNLRFFWRDEDGSHNQYPPTTLEEISKDQLRRYMIYQRSTNIATDREMSAGYLHREASYVRNSVIKVLRERYSGHKEIARHEQACNAVNGLFDFHYTHHDDLHHAMEKLVHIDSNPQHEGDIATLTRFSPLYAHDALASNGYLEADEFFDRNAASYNVFHGASETEPIKAGRRDLLLDRWIRRSTLIEWELANGATHDFSIDFVKVDLSLPKFGLTDRQFEAANDICVKTDVELKDWLRIGQDFSKWTREPPQLKALSHPINAAYWFQIHSDDAHYVRLDILPSVAQKTGMAVSIGFSGSIGYDPRGSGKGNGYNRTFLDDAGVVDKGILLHNALRIKTDKDFVHNVEEYTEATEWTAGYDCNAKNKMALYGAFCRTVAMDLDKELMGQDGNHPLVPISDHQRLVGTGALALNTNKVEEFWHMGENNAGVNFKELFGSMAHAFELKMHIIVGKVGAPPWMKRIGSFVSDKTGWNGLKKLFRKQIDVGTYGWGKPFKKFGRFITRKTGWKGPERFFNRSISIKSQWVPRAFAWLLIGAGGLVFGGFASGKKGAEEAGGASGGSPAHGTH